MTADGPVSPEGVLEAASGTDPAGSRAELEGAAPRAQRPSARAVGQGQPVAHALQKTVGEPADGSRSG